VGALPGAPGVAAVGRVDAGGAVVIERRAARPAERGPAPAGRFGWDRLPEVLPVPAQTGLVSLAVRGQR
jgi:hypothetical protein